MKRVMGWITALLLVTAAALPCGATSVYLVYDQWGGTWHDANKTYQDDSLMCWAATASNILAYGNWGASPYNTEAAIFQQIKDHWTNNTGSIYWAEQWWFNGSPPPFNNYSHIDVPGGGNFFPTLNFWNYFASASNESSGGNLMAAIDTLLNQGKGVGLAIGNGGAVGHAVTVWGYSYSAPGDYTSIFLTDSDDGYYGLREYPLTYQNETWYLGGGYSGWTLGSAQALGYFTTPGIPGGLPEPGGLVPIAPTWVLFGTGVFSLLLRRRRRGA